MAEAPQPGDACAAGLDPRELWAPIVTQAAWSMTLLGVKIQAAPLRDAVEHTLRSLPPGISAEEAEFLTHGYVEDWLCRARDGRYRRPPDGLPENWPEIAPLRERLLARLDANTRLILRMRYNEGYSFQQISAQVRASLPRIEAADASLRDHLNALLEADGWEPQARPELELLLRRLSFWAEPGGVGPLGLAQAPGEALARRCPRAAKARRLILARRLPPAWLFPPPDPVPGAVEGVVALLLHPEASQHERDLVRLLGKAAERVANDAWLIPESRVAQLLPALSQACAEGTPPRHFIRGALQRGHGRWSKRTLLGPLPVAALERARARPWGDLDGLAELPPPKPALPSSRAWWAAAVAMVGLTAGAAVWAAQPPGATPAARAHADFLPSPGGWSVQLEVPDLAHLDIVTFDGSEGRVIHRDLRAAKGFWATGQGDYLIPLRAQTVCLISSEHGIDDLESFVATAKRQQDPQRALAEALREAHPGVDVIASPSPQPEAPR